MTKLNIYGRPIPTKKGDWYIYKGELYEASLFIIDDKGFKDISDMQFDVESIMHSVVDTVGLCNFPLLICTLVPTVGGDKFEIDGSGKVHFVKKFIRYKSDGTTSSTNLHKIWGDGDIYIKTHEDFFIKIK
jgi:hypothetical protein